MFNELQEIIQEALGYGFITLATLFISYLLVNRFFSTNLGQKILEKIQFRKTDFKNTEGPVDFLISEERLADNFENLIKFIHRFIVLLTTTTCIFIPSVIIQKSNSTHYDYAICLSIVLWMILNLFYVLAFGTFGIIFNLRKSLAENNKKYDRIEGILLNIQDKLDRGKS